jgi:hypothetical protein
VLRRQQLQELEAQAQLVSAQAAGRAALRAWLQVRALHFVYMLLPAMADTGMPKVKKLNRVTQCFCLSMRADDCSCFCIKDGFCGSH